MAEKYVYTSESKDSLDSLAIVVKVYENLTPLRLAIERTFYREPGESTQGTNSRADQWAEEWIDEKLDSEQRASE